MSRALLRTPNFAGTTNSLKQHPSLTSRGNIVVWHITCLSPCCAAPSVGRRDRAGVEQAPWKADIRLGLG
jgi:hypothetical protein